MRTTYLIPITILALLSTVAGAADHVVRQKGRAFSVDFDDRSARSTCDVPER